MYGRKGQDGGCPGGGGVTGMGCEGISENVSSS